MPEEPDSRSPGDSRSGSPGLGESATGLLASGLDYLHARLELLTLEAREAKGDLLSRVILAFVGGFFFLITYLALCVGLVGWLSQKQDWPWPLTTFGLAGAHALIGLLLFAIARRKFGRPPFRDSLRELDEDRAWLRRHRKRRDS